MDELRVRMESAASCIRRAFRRYSAKKECASLVDERRKSVVVVQSFLRMVKAKEKAMLLRMERDEAAIRIQCLFRSRLLQKRCNERRMKKFEMMFIFVAFWFWFWHNLHWLSLSL